MKLTRQQLILICVLLAGAVVLTVDRLIIARPDGSVDAAARAADEYGIKRTDKTSPEASTLPSTRRPSLAQRLRAAAQNLSEGWHRDVFAMTSAWPQNNPTLPRADDQAVRQFRLSHRLTGILSTGANGYVMVDGKIIGIGQQIDGFRLVSISHRAATFESDKVRVVLYLAERQGDSVLHDVPEPDAAAHAVP